MVVENPLTENYIQVEFERLCKDIKEGFQHKLRSLTTKKDSFIKWDILASLTLPYGKERHNCPLFSSTVEQHT
jgi:hypothetical protein